MTTDPKTALEEAIKDIRAALMDDSTGGKRCLAMSALKRVEATLQATGEGALATALDLMDRHWGGYSTAKEIIREAALAPRASVDVWQDIETAPHETLVVLGWYEGDTFKQEIALASAGERFSNGYSNRWEHGQATYWMPLPPAPAKFPELVGGRDAI